MLEVLVVLAILGLLAIALCPSCTMGQTPRAKAAKVLADCDSIKKAVDRFKLKKGGWPASMEDLVAAGLIDPEPKDPWGNVYVLTSDGRRIGISPESMIDCAGK